VCVCVTRRVPGGYLGDELVVVGQVRPAVDAAVRSMAAGQVRLERLGARHSDHGRGGRAVQEGAAGPGRLAGEAPQDTGEGRGGRWGGRHAPAAGRRWRLRAGGREGGRRPQGEHDWVGVRVGLRLRHLCNGLIPPVPVDMECNMGAGPLLPAGHSFIMDKALSSAQRPDFRQLGEGGCKRTLRGYRVGKGFRR